MAKLLYLSSWVFFGVALSLAITFPNLGTWAIFAVAFCANVASWGNLNNTEDWGWQ